MRSVTSILATAGAFAVTVAALNPIVVKEQEFLDSVTNDRFVIIGVDYQPGGQASYGTTSSDPLSNATDCLRDAALMQDLGVNTIRSYNVDPTLNHDECVSIFNSVGIYMLIDVNSPLAGQSLDRSNPSGTYTASYLQHTFSVVEAFKNYPNVIGFFAGNEIINTVATGQNNPPYIRAIQRDLKNYIKNNAPRAIPVGYSAADVAEVLQDTWAYLQCNLANASTSSGGTDMSRSDFFGLNSYSWCGDASSYTISGYNTLVQMFGNSTIPTFFSEYGCIDPQPRYFDEVPTLYGPQMTTLSGGLVYQWTQDSSDYGLVQVNDNGTAQLLRDYDQLMSKYQQINVKTLDSSNSTATSLQPPACNTNLISSDGFSTDWDIPDTPAGAQAFIASGIPNPPKGSIVPVTQTSVQVAVYATNGGLLKNLAIHTGASAANAPGDAAGLSTAAVPSATSGGGGSNSSASATGAKTTPSSAAGMLDASVWSSAAGAVVLGAVAFAL